MITLGEVTDILSGFAFNSKYFNTDEGTPIIRIRDVVRGFSDTKYTGPFDKNYLVSNGDLLIGMDGEFNVAPWSGGEALLNQRVCKISTKDREVLDERYLLYFLPKELKRIEEKTPFVTVKHLSVKSIRDIKISLPPLHIQHQIADTLEKADALRRKDQILLQKYDELSQSIFNDMFGDPVKNEYCWKVKKLGESCDVGSSVRVFVDELVDQGIPFYRGTEIGGLSSGDMIEPSLFITEEHYSKLKHQGGVPKIGDLLMPSICPDGRIYQVQDKSPFYFKDGRVLWVKVSEKYYNSTFLMYLLKETFLRCYSSIASGTTFAELKIFALKKLELPIPPLEVQNRFAAQIEYITKCSSKSKKARSMSENLFSNIISSHFS